jgi:hypothetical protein
MPPKAKLSDEKKRNCGTTGKKAKNIKKSKKSNRNTMLFQ